MKNKGVHNGGFGSLIAVIMLATGTLAVSISAMAGSITYADGVARRNLRVQARMNVRSCLESASLMLLKNPFLNGTTTLRDFGCAIEVENPVAGGLAEIRASAVLSGVGARASRLVSVREGSVTVVEERTE